MNNKYKTLVFDCDGVILNSNKVKTAAFYKTALVYGEQAAQELIKYHVENGGVSRYKKFAYFLEKIVPNFSVNKNGPDLENLLNHYAAVVQQGLLSCEVAEGLEELRLKTKHTNWLIVSGGDQIELRKVFAERDLNKYFDGGVFGSPDTKEKILERELGNNNIQQPALFLGDSKYDYKAANALDIDFIFLTEWTEIENYKEWCEFNSISFYCNIKSL